MEEIVKELRTIISEYTKKFADISENDFSARPLPHKWSKKEVLGHLIDSGQNNLRRFICGQYENQPPLIVYQQDFWVTSNAYHAVPAEDLIALWRLLNLRICAVLTGMPAENYSKRCNTGSLHSLRWLAADYVQHLKHHINQIISGSFDVIYK